MLILVGFDINKRTNFIQTIKQELVIRFQSVEEAAALIKSANQAKEESRFLNRILPPPEQLINFPKTVNNLASQHNVEVSFSFGQETAGSETEPGFISFTIAASGDYNDLVNFIKSLEQLQYQISFDSFNFADNDKNRFNSLINGKIFTQ